MDYKKIVLLFFLNAIGSCVFAQEESSFGMFLASPVGDFKSTTIGNGGFAKSGGGIVFDSKYPIKQLPAAWSFIFHSTYQWNNMDNIALGQKFTEQLGYRTEVSDSKYSPVLATFGPGYDFALGERIKLGLKAGIGVMFGNTKAFTVKVYDNNNNEIANQLVNFDNQISFAYSLGTELKFEIVKNLFALSLYSDYTSSKQSTELSFTSSPPVGSFQKLQYFNTGFKLVFMKKVDPSTL